MGLRRLQVKQKYSGQLVDLFAESFRYLPLVHVINGRVLVVHGGLFSQDGVKLDDIRAIDRNRWLQHPHPLLHWDQQVNLVYTLMR